jgi:hypothetical protein
MNKLSKAHQEQLAALRAEYTAARDDIATAAATANEQIRHLTDDLNEKIAVLNDVIERGNALRADIESAAQEHYESKSETWQEGERGSAYSDFVQSWGEELESVEEVEVEEIDPLSENPEQLLDEDQYPTEPNY